MCDDCRRLQLSPYCCIFHEHINMLGTCFFFFPVLSLSRSPSWHLSCRVSRNFPSPSSQRGHSAHWAEHLRGRGIRCKQVFVGVIVATKTAAFLLKAELAEQKIQYLSDPLSVAVTNIFCRSWKFLTVYTQQEV